MKAGFYADELEEVTDLYKAKDVAVWFADEKHQIDDGDDMEFEVFVEDDDGVIHQFDMGTEFDPVYHVKSSKPVIPK